MAEYKSYRDANGITWTIITAAKALMATVSDDAEPRYIPPATDMAQTILSDDGTEVGRAEAERKAFEGLRAQVDAWASQHTLGTGLTVRASAGGGVPWWLWAGLALAYLSTTSRRS